MAEPTPEPGWRRSSAPGDNTCVEVARTGEQAAIRSSGNPAAVLRTSRSEWTASLERIAAGDLPDGFQAHGSIAIAPGRVLSFLWPSA